MSQRFNKTTRDVFGMVAVLVAAVFAWLLGRRMPTDNFQTYINWPLVAVAVALDFLGVNLMVRECKRSPRDFYKEMRDPNVSNDAAGKTLGGFVVLMAIGVFMILATFLPFTQRFVMWILRTIATIPYMGWLGIPQTVTQLTCERSGLLALVFMISITNWIWHHPLWRGRILGSNWCRWLLEQG